jgi:ribose transport system permease protein
MYAKGAVIYSGIPVSLTNFGSAHLFGNFPTIIVLPAVIVLAMWFMAKRTMFGRHLYAVGSNPVSSRLAGVRVNRTIVLSLVLAGVLSALGGVVFTARFGSVDPTSGSGYLLPAFAAAFLGTAILSDGRFSIFGTFLATYLVAFAGSGLLQLGLQYSGDVFNGIVLIGAVTLNELLKRRSRSAARSIARN